MRENVNYDGLMRVLANINDFIVKEKNAVASDTMEVTGKLNSVGFQGAASATIDSSFEMVKSDLDKAHEYIVQLINWVNTNVIKEYQSADEAINACFQSALTGENVVDSYDNVRY